MKMAHPPSFSVHRILTKVVEFRNEVSRVKPSFVPVMTSRAVEPHDPRNVVAYAWSPLRPPCPMDQNLTSLVEASFSYIGHFWERRGRGQGGKGPLVDLSRTTTTQW